MGLCSGLANELADVYAEYSGAFYSLPLPINIIAAGVAISSGFVINMSDAQQLESLCPEQVNSFLIFSIIFAYLYVSIYGGIFALGALSKTQLLVFFWLHIAHLVAVLIASFVVIDYLNANSGCQDLLQYKFSILCIAFWGFLLLCYIGVTIFYIFWIRPHLATLRKLREVRQRRTQESMERQSLMRGSSLNQNESEMEEKKIVKDDEKRD